MKRKLFFGFFTSLLWLAVSNNALAQQFNGYYKLQTLFQEPENKCLEGNRLSPKSTLGGAAFMDTCQNVSGQYWSFKPAGNGYFKMQTLFQAPENKCFEGNRLSPKSTLKGAAFMDTCQNVTGQLWKIKDAGNGYYRLQTKFLESQNKCLEGNRFSPKSTLAGAAFMDTCQNVSGQLWKITSRKFVPSPEVPHDLTTGKTPYPKVSLTDLAEFAWKEFVALNYPADPNHRGQALAGSALGDTAAARVWETYWHRVEVFPASQNPVQNKGVAVVTGKPTYDYSPAFSLDKSTFDASGGPQDNQLWNNLDEDNELNVDEMFAHVATDGGNPAKFTGFTNENRIIFEAKMNEEGFNYILANKLYQSSVRDKLVANTMVPANLLKYGGSCGKAPNTIVSLPCGAIGGAEGNIEIKAAWRLLTAAEKSSGKYYTNSVIRYHSVSVNGKATNKWLTDTYGLIGLHIIHKTVNFPTFVFATFEHVDNIASGIGYIDEITQTGRGSGDTAGKKVVITKRDNPIPTAVAAVNSKVQAAISGTVWKNYQLIGVQAYPVDYSTVSGSSKPGTADKSTYYLANIVVESNEELQNFRGLKAGNNPDSNNTVASGKHLNMGGCMGCHGVAEINGSDFSFLIKNSPFTAPEVVGGSGVINFLDIKTYADVQEMFTSFVALNGISSIKNAPHKKFWETLSYTDFTTGNVPGVTPAVKIVDCKNSGNSNIVKILTGPINNGYPPEMPAGGPYFPEEQVESFAKWVDGGCNEK